MVEVGRRLRFVLEALHVQRRRQLAGQDHLQRHDAVEADLPRLEHDAHAAARDLLQDLVVAEVAHVVAHDRHADRRAVRADRRRLRGGRRDRHGEPGELLAVGEERGQFVGQVWMFGKQFQTVGRLSRFDRLDVGGQHFLQALFPVGRIRCFVHGSSGESRVFFHHCKPRWISSKRHSGFTLLGRHSEGPRPRPVPSRRTAPPVAAVRPG